MTQGAVSIPTTIVSSMDNGFGDNTLVWEPTGLSFGFGQPDQTVTVTVEGVLVSGVPRSVTYEVTIIDPGLGAVFSDGFEAGDTAAWSSQVP